MRHADRNTGFERDREVVFEREKLFSLMFTGPAMEEARGNDVNVN